MKKIIFLSVVVLLAGSFLASCSDQKDCTCTYSATKSAGSATQPVYDWGGSCSSIQASDLDLSGNYNVSCTEM